jgi:hypothetical protein
VEVNPLPSAALVHDSGTRNSARSIAPIGDVPFDAEPSEINSSQE